VIETMALRLSRPATKAIALLGREIAAMLARAVGSVISTEYVGKRIRRRANGKPENE